MVVCRQTVAVALLAIGAWAGDLAEPTESLIDLAEKGDAEAHYELGRMYLYADGADRDILAAETLLCSAAEHDHCLAMLELARLYDPGNYLRWLEIDMDSALNIPDWSVFYPNFRNRADPVKWYKEAADNGSVTAMYELAQFYRQYMREELNVASWLEKAAMNGHLQAQYELGRDIYFIDPKRWHSQRLGMPQMPQMGVIQKNPYESYIWVTIYLSQQPDDTATLQWRDSVYAPLFSAPLKDYGGQMSMDSTIAAYQREIRANEATPRCSPDLGTPSRE